jgi:hypothetical protein
MSSSSPNTKDDSLSKAYFERFREITKSTNRIALLWIAALLIAWYPGLERVRRDATENSAAIQANNVANQRFENQIVQEHQTFVKTSAEADLYSRHQEQNKALKSYETQFKNVGNKRIPRKEFEDPKSYQERLKTAVRNEREHLKSIIGEINLRTTPLDTVTAVDQTKAETAQNEEKLLQRSFEQLERLKQNREIRSKQNQENHTAIAKQNRELREQRKGVAFEFLNQRFELPPLYAPIIWGIFLIGLIVYLCRSRFMLLSLSASVLRDLQDVTDTVKHQPGEVPWWLAPLPNLAPPSSDTVEPAQVGETAPTDEIEGASKTSEGAENPSSTESAVEDKNSQLGGQTQLYPWFRWGETSGVALFAVIIGLASLALLQIRVLWLELEISREVGTLREQSLVSIVTTVLLFITFFVIWVWFRSNRLIESDLNAAAKMRWILWITLFIGLTLLLFIVFGSLPSWGHRYALSLTASLFYVSILLTAELLLFFVYLQWQSKTSASAKETQISPNRTRRRFMIGAAAMAVLGLAGIGRAFTRASIKTARRRARPGARSQASLTAKKNPRKRLRVKRIAVSLLSGFYRNPKSRVVHYVSNGFLLCAPNSKHFKTDRLKLFNPFDPVSLETQILESRREDDTLLRARQLPSRDTRLSRRSTRKMANFEKEETGPSFGLPRTTLFSPFKFEPKTAADSIAKDRKFTSKPRLNLSIASYAFDQEALKLLVRRPLRKKDYRNACKLLVYGINHDIYAKAKSGARPSFHLYDLLAGISVRYNEPKYLKEMLRLIGDSNSTDLFQSRIQKWQNANKWYSRWSNYQRPVRWEGVSFI